MAFGLGHKKCPYQGETRGRDGLHTEVTQILQFHLVLLPDNSVHVENTTPPVRSSSSMRPFLESSNAGTNVNMFILMLFLFHITWRIIRIMMIFFLQSFCFLSKLSRTKETDPREAGDAAYTITTSQKRTEAKAPCHLGDQRMAPSCKGKILQSLEMGKIKCPASGVLVLSSRISRDCLLLQDEHLKQISINKAIFPPL